MQHGHKKDIHTAKKNKDDRVKSLPKWLRRLDRRYVFVALFAAVGILALVLARAASPVFNFEAENGDLSGATSQSDGTASAGSFLQFGSGGSTGDAPGGVKLGRSVSYESGGHTISFNFQCDGGDCKYGLFANEVDYWVAPRNPGGSVTITGMTPAQTGSGNGVRHGAQIDSDSETVQGWYGAIAYSAALNFTGGTFSSSQLATPKVILKSKTRAEAIGGASGGQCVDNIDRQCLEFVASLTMVASPPGYVFRPPFFGSGPYKPMIPYSEYKADAWPSVPPVGSLVSWQAAYNTLRFPQTSVFYYPSQEESFHARQNVQSSRAYTGYVAKVSESAMLRAVTTASNAEETELKRKLKLAIAQRAIDFWGVVKNGEGKGSNSLCGPWHPSGGFHQGYFGRLMAGSALLGKTQAWSAELNTKFQTELGRHCFSEIGFTQKYQGIGRNAPLFGHKPSAADASDAKTEADPNHQKDGGAGGQTGCPPSYMDQTWEIGRGEVGYLQTIPTVRQNMPNHGLEWVTYVRRVHDVGAYCNPGSNAGIRIEDTSRRPSGAIEMFNAYRSQGQFDGL